MALIAFEPASDGLLAHADHGGDLLGSEVFFAREQDDLCPSAQACLARCPVERVEFGQLFWAKGLCKNNSAL